MRLPSDLRASVLRVPQPFDGEPLELLMLEIVPGVAASEGCRRVAPEDRAPAPGAFRDYAPVAIAAALLLVAALARCG